MLNAHKALHLNRLTWNTSQFIMTGSILFTPVTVGEHTLQSRLVYCPLTVTSNTLARMVERSYLKEDLRAVDMYKHFWTNFFLPSCFRGRNVVQLMFAARTTVCNACNSDYVQSGESHSLHLWWRLSQTCYKHSIWLLVCDLQRSRATGRIWIIEPQDLRTPYRIISDLELYYAGHTSWRSQRM